MTTGRQLFTTLAQDGTLTVEIGGAEFPQPTGHKVLVRMEAAPINPSDLALLFGPADLENAEYSDGRVVAKIPEPFASAMKGRHDQRLPVGNEGAGTVIAAGEEPMAQALLGQRVACVPGNAYSEYALAEATMCLPLGEADRRAGSQRLRQSDDRPGLRRDRSHGGTPAIVHAAAASNLGQMLNRICQEDGIAPR
jgi:threonine dehydrogenase-like Zn-dependent dehydrogenase